MSPPNMISSTENNGTTSIGTSSTGGVYQSVQVKVPDDHYYYFNGPKPTTTSTTTTTTTSGTSRCRSDSSRWKGLIGTSIIIFVGTLVLWWFYSPSLTWWSFWDHQTYQSTTFNRNNNNNNSNMSLINEIQIGDNYNDDTSSLRSSSTEASLYSSIDKSTRQKLLNLNSTINGRVWIRDYDDPIQFNQAARVWRLDRQLPIAVVEVLNEYDVQLAMPVLAELSSSSTTNIPFRIRSGGHSKAGYSTVANGIILSLKHMTSATIIDQGTANQLYHRRLLQQEAVVTTADTKYNDTSHINKDIALAIIEPGATVEHVLDSFITGSIETVTSSSLEEDTVQEGGYAGAVGQCGRVAEGGWVLGGGVGFMSRLLGLGLDNVIGFRVVLYNGTVISCSANDNNNKDLFWALRGAGSGNFGVVTSMIYKLHRSVPDKQLFRIVLLPFHKMGNFFYQLGASNTNHEFMLIVGGRQQPPIDQPNDITAVSYLSWFTTNGTSTINDTRSVANNHYDTIIRPMLPQASVSSVGTSSIYNSIGENDVQDQQEDNDDDTYQIFQWAESTHQFYDQGGYGLEVYAAQPWQGFLMPINNTIEIWNDITRIMNDGMIESPEVSPHIELWGGAISTVPINDTAFPYRDAIYNVGVLLVIQDYNDTAQERFDQQVSNVNKWWPNVAQYLTGSYLNYPMNSLNRNEYPQLYWGNHIQRLMSIKQQYDPNNIFNYEQSIPPLPPT